MTDGAANDVCLSLFSCCAAADADVELDDDDVFDAPVEAVEAGPVEVVELGSADEEEDGSTTEADDVLNGPLPITNEVFFLGSSLSSAFWYHSASQRSGMFLAKKKFSSPFFRDQ